MVNMKETPKFNKRKCLKCAFVGMIGNLGYMLRTRKGTAIRPYCNYIGITGIPCLRRGKGDVDYIDLRGNDYDNCRLFKSKERTNGK